MNKNNFNTLDLKYDYFFDGHFADKPMFMDGSVEEQCICITHKTVKVCKALDVVKPNNIKLDYICFDYLADRNIWVSLDLFVIEDEYGDNLEHAYGRSCGEWGYQLVLIDKNDHYVIDYQDGFITGDARGGDDFQQLTSDWQ